MGADGHRVRCDAASFGTGIMGCEQHARERDVGNVGAISVGARVRPPRRPLEAETLRP
jgi:hypothetical protein